MSVTLYASHVLLELFTFREHKILHNRDKFQYDINVGITFQTDKKILVKFSEIVFKKNKQKHYPLTISRNLHILMKFSFIDICIIIIFKKKEQFSCNSKWFDILLKHTAVRSSHRSCSVKKGVLKNSANFTGKHLCWSLFLLKWLYWNETLTQVFSCEIC